MGGVDNVRTLNVPNALVRRNGTPRNEGADSTVHLARRFGRKSIISTGFLLFFINVAFSILRSTYDYYPVFQ
jgi:hypothetical protein